MWRGGGVRRTLTISWRGGAGAWLGRMSVMVITGFCLSACSTPPQGTSPGSNASVAAEQAVSIVTIDLVTTTTEVIAQPGAIDQSYKFHFVLRSAADASTTPLFLRAGCSCLSMNPAVIANPAVDGQFDLDWKPTVPLAEDFEAGLDIITYDGTLVRWVTFKRPGKK